MTTTIAQLVSNLVETMAAQPPNEVMGAFARELAELAAKGVPEGVIEVGATLPCRRSRSHSAFHARSWLGSDRQRLERHRRPPWTRVGMNAYAATKAHTLNLAAELAGSGVTVNVHRPGSVDTDMQRWIRSQLPEEDGAVLHKHFRSFYELGSLITPEHSARSLLAQLAGNATVQISPVDDA